MDRPLEIGFYGKLPSHGDFLRRRVSDAFVGVWDAWLQECIAASRAALGDRWLEVYLTSPAWRFGCAAGSCGPAPVIGLMVPSVDRVGRYFPLTVVAELPPDASIISAAVTSSSFLDHLERLVLDTLEADRVDFEAFDEEMRRLGEDAGGAGISTGVILEPAAAAVLGDGGHTRWHIPIAGPPQLAPAFEQLLSHRLSLLYDPLVLWWTEGSSIVEPSCLIGRGLPDPDSFAALLEGGWARHQWPSVPAYVESAPSTGDTLIDPVPPRFRSASATNVGRVRDINQDAYLERLDVGLWAVADGLGGHSEGEVASRMVCDALADFIPELGFDETIDAARQRIQEVNEHLHRAATRPLNPVRSGSTVVALLTRGSRCAVIWAGDSRVYRWRGGRLEQMTRDHSVAEQEGRSDAETANAITRAVGGEPTLTMDVVQDRVAVGDRFLLCSDGLTRTVSDVQIRALLEHPDIRTAVERLIAATLDAGAPDNVTVVIVEAYPAPAA